MAAAVQRVAELEVRHEQTKRDVKEARALADHAVSTVKHAETAVRTVLCCFGLCVIVVLATEINDVYAGYKPSNAALRTAMVVFTSLVVVYNFWPVKQPGDSWPYFLVSLVVCGPCVPRLEHDTKEAATEEVEAEKIEVDVEKIDADVDRRAQLEALTDLVREPLAVAVP